MLNPIALPKSIEDLCKARDSALNKIESARRLLADAESEIHKVSHYCWPYQGRIEGRQDELKEELDRRLWRYAFDKTGLFQYMDAQARREFDNDLDKKPPEFTMNSVQTTLLSVAQEADTLFARGLVNFFLSLSKNHKTNTNEPFKVSKKAILKYAVCNFIGMTINYSTYGNGSATINDLDRIFKTLDGKQHQPRELETSINAAWKESNIYEDDYYQIKGFKNGNAHILFKRQDLLEKANRLISEYYDGKGLATDRAI